MRKGHTIIELLVAMGLLVAIMAGSGVVFKGAIDAHRTANATAEVSRKLRTITEQLDADFAGLRKDGLIAVKFVKGGSDQIIFFSDGNFEAYNATFTGNMARIYYGAANLVDWDGAGSKFNELTSYTQSGLLARRQHILSVAEFGFPDIDRDGFDITFTPFLNNRNEFDEMTFENWKSHCNVADIEIGDLAIEQIVVENMNKVFDTCFSDSESFADSGRAGIDLDGQSVDPDGKTLQLLMSQGVSDFKVAFEYFAGGQLTWWPSEQIIRDTDDNGSPDMSDYDMVGIDEFGVFFNMGANLTSPVNGDWGPAGYWGYPFVGFPRALKFTFTLYDSNGVFSDGKTFSHIVYLAN